MAPLPDHHVDRLTTTSTVTLDGRRRRITALSRPRSGDVYLVLADPDAVLVIEGDEVEYGELVYPSALSPAERADLLRRAWSEIGYAHPETIDPGHGPAGPPDDWVESLDGPFDVATAHPLALLQEQPPHGFQYLFFTGGSPSKEPVILIDDDGPAWAVVNYRDDLQTQRDLGLVAHPAGGQLTEPRVLATIAVAVLVVVILVALLAL